MENFSGVCFQWSASLFVLSLEVPEVRLCANHHIILNVITFFFNFLINIYSSFNFNYFYKLIVYSEYILYTGGLEIDI